LDADGEEIGEVAVVTGLAGSAIYWLVKFFPFFLDAVDPDTDEIWEEGERV